MMALAAFWATILGFGLLHAADPARLPFAFSAKSARWWPRALRLGAATALAGALALFSSGSGWAEGILITSAAAIFVASLFVVLAPIASRFIWAMVAVSPAALALFSLLEGLHGR